MKIRREGACGQGGRIEREALSNMLHVTKLLYVGEGMMNDATRRCYTRIRDDFEENVKALDAI